MNASLSLSPIDLAPHILRAMTVAQRDGRRADLETLRDELGVRRADIRRAISAMHRDDLVDATRWCLTLRGFALGTAYAARGVNAMKTGRHAPRAAVAA